MKQYDIGLVGLGVMGMNLMLNFHDKGYSLAVFDQNKKAVDLCMNGLSNKCNIAAKDSLKSLIHSLQRPRKIMLMIPAGEPVDAIVQQLKSLLDAGDIIIDGGNSHFVDTNRRVEELQRDNILFVGLGVSGGEEGARNGPSLMPGGNPKAWPVVRPMLQAIAARIEDEPCCEWLGSGGAGHYVKMVHNGIEYAEMQLIAESYQLMFRGLGLNHREMEAVFEQWNKGALGSYLLEITACIMATVDTDGLPLLEKIRDCSGQKGTGKWTVHNALEDGVSLGLIAEAVFSRFLSVLKSDRVKASYLFPCESRQAVDDKEGFLQTLHAALYASKCIAYAQGFLLLQQASKKYQWALDFSRIALSWQGGCIIRCELLNPIKDAYSRNPQLENLLLDEYFIAEMNSIKSAWRKLVLESIGLELPVPAFSSALSFFDAYRQRSSPANLIQAQRDYFGAHTYKRIDREEGESFHTDWSKPA